MRFVPQSTNTAINAAVIAPNQQPFIQNPPPSSSNATVMQQQSTEPIQLLPQQQPQSNRHSDPLGGLTKDKMPNFSDLAKATPPFKDYLNNLQTYAYLQQLEQSEAMQPRHTQITQQYSSSTDEGCETNDGKGIEIILKDLKILSSFILEMDDTPPPTTITSNIQRLNSYASSSSSSGVATNYHSKSLSQNLSCDSSRSNFSTFESLDLNLSDCSDLASSLPSCASGNANEGEAKEDCKFNLFIFLEILFLIVHSLYFQQLIVQ